MAVGYWIGTLFDRPAPDRNHWLSRAGGLLLLGFVVLRFNSRYGDARLWDVQPRGAIYTVLLFFCIGHILLLYGVAEAWTYLQDNKVMNLMFDKPGTWPAAYAPNLVRLYTVWFVAVVTMYYACRWYGGIKRRYNYAYPS